MVARQAKLPLTKPPLLLKCRIRYQLLYFQSSFLGMHTVEGSVWWPKCLGPCHPYQRLGWSSWLLAPGPALATVVTWGVSQWISLSLSGALSNKSMNLKTKRTAFGMSKECCPCLS